VAPPAPEPYTAAAGTAGGFRLSAAASVYYLPQAEFFFFSVTAPGLRLLGRNRCGCGDLVTVPYRLSRPPHGGLAQWEYAQRHFFLLRDSARALSFITIKGKSALE
jgi:hypothetical protein